VTSPQSIYLVKEFLGVDYALELVRHFESSNINELLLHIKLRERWQRSPDVKQLKDTENELHQ